MSEEEDPLASVKARFRAIARNPAFKAWSESWGKYLYGNASKELMQMAEEIRRAAVVDEKDISARLAENPNSPVAPIWKEELRKLSVWLSKVKKAAQEGDVEFFEKTAKAVQLLNTPPSANNEVIHFAFLTLLDYRRAGIEPRKADIIAEVEKKRSKFGRVKGSVLWQERVFKLPVFAGIKGRKKGEAPRPLPPEWR